MKKTFRIVAFSAAAALFCAGFAASYWTDRIELKCTIPVLYPANITIIEDEVPEMQDTLQPDASDDMLSEQGLPEPIAPAPAEDIPSEPPEAPSSIPNDKTELPPEIDPTPAPPQPDEPSPAPASPSPAESSGPAETETPEA